MENQEVNYPKQYYETDATTRFNGYAVIQQDQLYETIFDIAVNKDEIQVYDNFNEYQEYLINIHLEYIRISLEYDCPLSKKARDNVLTLILRNRKFVLIHFLLQYRIISDSFIVAKILCKLGNNQLDLTIDLQDEENEKQWQILLKDQFYEPALQLGTDMLHRLQQHKLLISILTESNMTREAYELTKRLKQLQETQKCMQKLVLEEQQ